MRILYVVQRYAVEMPGGAEQLCRMYAEQLAGRGHRVEVLTSCAHDYVTWENTFPVGAEGINGVTVHRLPVVRPRNSPVFSAADSRMRRSPGASPPLQHGWMFLQGPTVGGLERWIWANAARFDVAVFMGYLYYTTWAGLRAASGRLATVLHPTAHDEEPIRNALIAENFARADALAYLTVEEGSFVEKLFPFRTPSKVIGIGMTLPVEKDATAFRRQYGLGAAPYLLYLGRLDHAKSVPELLDFFRAYKLRRAGDLQLALVGEAYIDVPSDEDLLVTGFVGDDMRASALEGATLFVQPSYFESFSIALAESWAHGKAALVQKRCAVLYGQALRSGGALPYAGYGEFETALDTLLASARLRSQLGASGHSYVASVYGWDNVLDRYESLLDSAPRLRRVPGRRHHKAGEAS